MNWRFAHAERGNSKGRTATDATAIIITMITVGATLLLTVSGAAWRIGSRLGAVEQGLAGCQSEIREIRTDIRELNRKVDRILERLPPTLS